MSIVPLDSVRRKNAKAAFSTRRLKSDEAVSLIWDELRPKTGDVVLARVDELGKQKRLELANGRRAFLYPGDEILVAYGNRYAPDQYEAVIGIDLSPCDLVAAGGIAAFELARQQRMIQPTQITPLGYLGDKNGKRLNLIDYRVQATEKLPQIPAILSLGTSMNAGKSLAAASLVRGFKRLGIRVASLKVTGTGSGGDLWIAKDAGADVVADFTDAGYASTYLTPISEIESATYRLMNHAANEGCQIAVIEIADGLQQQETSALVRSHAINRIALGSIFSAYDSMGAISGVDHLEGLGHNLIGLSGRVGMSPLGVREAEAATSLKYYSPADVQQGVVVPIVRRLALEKLKNNADGMGAALEFLSADIAQNETNGRFEEYQTASLQPKNSRQLAACQVLQFAANFVLQFEFQRSMSHTSQKTNTRRCTSLAKSTGKRCRRHSKRGWIVCHLHGAGGGAQLDETHTDYKQRLLSKAFTEQNNQINKLVKKDRSKRRTNAAKYQSRVWCSEVGLVHLSVPCEEGEVYKPKFVSSGLNKEIVHSVVQSIGTKQFVPSIHRLVSLMGVSECEGKDLLALADSIFEACIELGVEPNEEELDGPLTVDNLIDSEPISTLPKVNGTKKPPILVIQTKRPKPYSKSLEVLAKRRGVSLGAVNAKDTQKNA